MSAKITDLINKKFSYSFEVTPEVSRDVIENLDPTVDPLFFSVTWHAKSHKCENLDIAPIQIAKFLSNNQKPVLMHLSCDMLKISYLDELLNALRGSSICNLFVILGEKYDASSSDFKSSQELITHIKKATGDYFCIGVAGFPDHSGDKLLQLKEKVDSGADFIITQAFFEKDTFKTFLKSCKDLGITVPIIPGIFLFENLQQLSGFINLCKVKVSNDVLERVQNKDDLNPPGRELIRKLVQDITSETGLKHFHFFTLNKLSFVSEFLKEF